MSQENSTAVAQQLEDATSVVAPSTKRRKVDGDDDTASSNAQASASEPGDTPEQTPGGSPDSPKVAAPTQHAPAKIGSGSFVPVAGPLGGGFVPYSAAKSDAGQAVSGFQPRLSSSGDSAAFSRLGGGGASNPAVATAPVGGPQLSIPGGMPATAMYGMSMMGHHQLPRVGGAPMVLGMPTTNGAGQPQQQQQQPTMAAYPYPHGGFLMMDSSGHYQRIMAPGFDPTTGMMLQPQPQQQPLQQPLQQQQQQAQRQLSQARPLTAAPVVSTPSKPLGPQHRAPSAASRGHSAAAQAAAARESAANKRNKFFYKELREHLENKLRPSIGWLSDIYFVMDPKLHVGPINRDGTFEKRVRLHFIEWMEVKNINVWICWGILLDQTRHPVFRESSNLYRIPGNQSSMFKTNRSFQGWAVADDEQRRILRNHANDVRSQLEGRWDGYSTEAARRMIKIDAFELPPASMTGDGLLDGPLDLRSGKPTTRSDTFKQELTVDTRTPEEIAMDTWEQMGYKVPQKQQQNGTAEEKGEDGVTAESSDEPIRFEDETFQSALCRALGITTFREDILKVFRLLVAKEGKMSYELWLTAVKRFGFGHRMVAKMLDLLHTAAFNGDMSTEDAENVLLHCEAGCYLIRYSRSSPEHFCICWRWKDKIEQMNRISNDPAGGIVVDVGAEPLRFADWRTFISAAEIMSKHVIANSKTEYSFAEHHVNIEKIMSDDRYSLRTRSGRRRLARSYAALAGHTSGDGDDDDIFSQSSEEPEQDNSDGDGSFHLPNSNVPSPQSDDSIGPSSSACVAFEDKYHAPFPLPSAHPKPHPAQQQQQQQQSGQTPSPSPAVRAPQVAAAVAAAPAFIPSTAQLPTLPRQAVHLPQMPIGVGVPQSSPYPMAGAGVGLPMNAAGLRPLGVPAPAAAATVVPGPVPQAPVGPTEIRNTLLQYLAQLTALNKLDSARFSKWAVQLSNERFAALSQLATLHNALKDHPDLWISAAGPLLDMST